MAKIDEGPETAFPVVVWVCFLLTSDLPRHIIKYVRACTTGK
jgi:hypothetical protein